MINDAVLGVAAVEVIGFVDVGCVFSSKSINHLEVRKVTCGGNCCNWSRESTFSTGKAETISVVYLVSSTSKDMPRATARARNSSDSGKPFRINRIRYFETEEFIVCTGAGEAGGGAYQEPPPRGAIGTLRRGVGARLR